MGINGGGGVEHVRTYDELASEIDRERKMAAGEEGKKDGNDDGLVLDRSVQ